MTQPTRMHRTRAAQLVVIALALLALAWAVTPRTAPPLYDGVNFPDEPYRFVVAPAGASATKAATTAKDTVDVIDGKSGAVSAQSAEQAPQVAVLIPVGRLHAAAGATSVVMTATPVQPVAAPKGGYLWSNVYEVSAGAGVTMSDASPAATLTLRAATSQRPVPTIERYTDGRWTPIKSYAAGNDIYQSALPGLGRYAIIGSKPLDLSKNSATSRTGILIAVGAGVVIVVLAVIGVRRRRSTARQVDSANAAPEPPAPVSGDEP